MDNDIDPKILEEIRKLSISSNVKFNRFFGDLTPETKNVLETIIRHYIPKIEVYQEPDNTEVCSP